MVQYDAHVSTSIYFAVSVCSRARLLAVLFRPPASASHGPQSDTQSNVYTQHDLPKAARTFEVPWASHSRRTCHGTVPYPWPHDSRKTRCASRNHTTRTALNEQSERGPPTMLPDRLTGYKTLEVHEVTVRQVENQMINIKISVGAILRMQKLKSPSRQVLYPAARSNQAHKSLQKIVVSAAARLKSRINQFRTETGFRQKYSHSISEAPLHSPTALGGGTFHLAHPIYTPC
jgi:hypothetical protein